MAHPIATNGDFENFTDKIMQESWWRVPLGFGIARIEYGRESNTIACRFPVVNWNGENAGSLAAMLVAARENDAAVDIQDTELVLPFTPDMAKTAASYLAPFMDEPSAHKNAGVIRELLTIHENGNYFTNENDKLPRFKLVALFGDDKCQSVESVYLKLLAISEGHAKPRDLNLDGIFGILPNLAWSGNKPYELDWLRENKTALMLKGEYPTIDAVDKIPYFLHHVIPADNTRILESAKVRLGAHIAPGTTLMPGASYINFNAGTLGPAMVEGRISSSATIGPGTDIGGGASILGVLSGGNATPITIGANCLLGANCVCGIPLGDGCIIDAGIAVLAGSKVHIKDKDVRALAQVNEKSLPFHENSLYKAGDLAGMNGIHFRLDTTTGQLIAFRSNYELKLNKDLH